MTILHKSVGSQINSSDFTEEQCLFVVKLLVDKGIDPLARDPCYLTPTLLATAECTYGYSIVLDYLLERGEIPRIDKIDVLELAGAKILRSHILLGASDRHKSFEYWRRALQLRQLETEKCSSITPQNIVKF